MPAAFDADGAAAVIRERVVERAGGAFRRLAKVNGAGPGREEAAVEALLEARKPAVAGSDRNLAVSRCAHFALPRFTRQSTRQAALRRGSGNLSGIPSSRRFDDRAAVERVFSFLSVAISVLPLAAEEVPLTGRVSSGGQPVAGAVVRLTAVPDLALDFELRFSGGEPAELARAKSGAAGAFALAGPAEGFYRLAIAAEGYLAGEFFIFSTRAKRQEELRLAPARG